MDAVRNFIHVLGITPEEELPCKPSGQMVQYSEIETIHIPMDKPSAESIFQIMVGVEVKSTRIIKSNLFKTMVIEGVKKFKIIYTGRGDSDKANFLSIQIPYNTFIELPEGCSDIEGAKVFILDAYFDLLDDRRIYSFMLYLVHVDYAGGSIENKKIVSHPLELPQGIIEEMLISEGPSGEVKIYENISGYKKERELSDNSLIDIDAEYL